MSAAPVAEPGTPQPLPARESAAGSTGFAPVVRVRAPGVRLAAWPGLVGLGAVVALLAMSLLASRLGLPVTHVLVLALVASLVGLVGLVGAKLYYLAEHPTYARSLASMTGGMCIQGFVLAANRTIVLGALLWDLSVGSVLDATAPGLLFGMAIGRVGCFLGGCCAGRPTASRWGLWSS
ncbi:MAG: prolipoprotein diacylglyceryl transferase, partial [Geodermatophilaceae bacterium]|nr:prolipoprotein diacylglyceryl transferase [Geodermatophilaceae bacterium]